MKTPCAIPLFTVVCVLTVLAQAANTSLTNSHARRSLERSNRQHHRHAHAAPRRVDVAEEEELYQRKRVFDARGPLTLSSSLSLPTDSATSSSATDTASSSSSASASASSPSITASDPPSSSASATDSASSSAATDSASSSESVAATDSATSSAAATDSASSSPSVTDSATNTASASPSPTVTDPPASTSDSPTSTNPPASSATCDPLDLLCMLTQSAPSSSPTSDPPVSTPAPTSDLPASTADPTSDSASPTVTDPPASTSNSPTSTDAPASSTACDPLDVVCIGSTILFPSSTPTSELPASTPAPTSDTPQTDSSSPADSTTQTRSATGTPVSTTDAPASTSDVVSDIVNTVSSLLPTSTSDKPDQTQTESSTPTDSSLPTQSITLTDSSPPTQSDKPTDSVSQSNQATQTVSRSDQATQTVSQSDQATQTDTSSGTQTISQPPPTNTVTQTNSVSDSFIDTKTVTASDSPTDSATESITHTQSVSFPTLTESPTDSEPTATATDSIASATITDSQASVTMTTQPIPSEYSYITDSSLALTSLPATTTLSFSLLDPDAAFTTASLTQSGTAAPSQAVAFPTQLPTRIFPANRLDPNDPSLQGMVLVSLKFLNTLTWSFVVNNSNTAALLFVYTPQTIANALGIPVSQVLTFAMQAFAPADYSGDISQLSTVYLLYIPADQVDALQQQLLTQNSPLYADQAGIPKQISAQLDATFPVNAVGLDTTIVGTGASSNGSNSGSADASAASRRDAIIGVCAAFGVILLVVVFWWVYKSWRRRQDKAHRRLTHDSAGMHQAGGYGATTQSAYGTVYGVAPQRSGYAQPHTPMYTTTGAPIANPFEDASYEEDPDERRRSFFYAEDSLRGYTVQREEDQGITYTQVIRAQQGLAPNDGKRRAPIQASAISAPILRESSLNW